MRTRAQWRNNREYALGEGNPVIVDQRCLARWGMDKGYLKKNKGLCFYCQIYGSILIYISRICKLSFARGLAVWYVLVVLIQYLDQKANVFILGIPVTIENFPRRRQRPDGSEACMAPFALSPQLAFCCFALSSFIPEHLWVPNVCQAWQGPRTLDAGNLEQWIQLTSSLPHGVCIRMRGKGIKDAI